MSKFTEAYPVPLSAYASASAPPVDFAPNEVATREYLNTRNWPKGLINFLLKTVNKIPYRFFICDDSGSMATTDGKCLEGDRDNTKVVSCDRWKEMRQSLNFHANLARSLDIPCEFRMLNSAPPYMIGGPDSDPSNFTKFISALSNNSPGGGTPLCRHIREVTEKVRAMEPVLRAAGEKVAIIIVTDGEASDGDLRVAMAPLKDLPIWVVVRLCTDDERVVNYWNSIDEDLELEMDVLDDMLGESEETYKVNPWLTYSESFHRMREFGVHMKELDLIDEQLLSADQVRAVCAVLFDVFPSEIPHPEAEPDKFFRRIDTLNREYPRIYSLKHRRMFTFVDTAQLKRLYSKKAGCTVS